MSAAKTRSRCRRPMQEQAGNGAFPVCGRPEGHPGYPEKCLSEATYDAQLALQAAVRRGEETPRRPKRAAAAARPADFDMSYLSSRLPWVADDNYLPEF